MHSAFLVREKGFEPPTFWFVAKHSIQLSYSRMSLFPDDSLIIAQFRMECKCFFRFFSFFSKFLSNPPFAPSSPASAGTDRLPPCLPLAKNLILFLVLFSILSKRFFFFKCYKLFTISEKTHFFLFQPFQFPAVSRPDGRNFWRILLRSDNGQKGVVYL